MNRIIDGGYVAWVYGSSLARQESWMPEEYYGDVFAMDGPREQLFRTALLPTYKQRRQDRREAYEPLQQTHDLVVEFRQKAYSDTRLNKIAYAGLEADDLIALLAWMYGPIDVVGIDKDLLQLKPHIRYIMPINGDEVTLARYYDKLPKTLQRIGFSMHLFPLYLALMGDKTDGIPRLIPPHQLEMMVDIVSCKHPYNRALDIFRQEFLQNLMGIILPFPGCFGLEASAVFEMVASGEWGPRQLLDRLDVQIRDTIQEVVNVSRDRGGYHRHQHPQQVEPGPQPERGGEAQEAAPAPGRAQEGPDQRRIQQRAHRSSGLAGTDW